MSDTELDELLDKWSAPEAPAALRERVRAGFGAVREQKMIAGRFERWRPVFAAVARKGLLVAGCVAAGALLFTVSLAFPQSTVRPPYVVDSELVTYAEDGSAGGPMRIDSYSDQGREVVLSRWYPDDPFKTAIGRFLDFWQSHVLSFTASRERIEQRSKVQAERAAAQAGCGDRDVVGHEMILGHPAVESQHLSSADRRRASIWMAPDLACFPLRITVEVQRPDGTFRLVWKREALKVTVNR
jgi:hypothetical protein